MGQVLIFIGLIFIVFVLPYIIGHRIMVYLNQDEPMFFQFFVGLFVLVICFIIIGFTIAIWNGAGYLMGLLTM